VLGNHVAGVLGQQAVVPLALLQLPLGLAALPHLDRQQGRPLLDQLLQLSLGVEQGLLHRPQLGDVGVRAVDARRPALLVADDVGAGAEPAHLAVGADEAEDGRAGALLE
jgi:hypothetical protein